MLRDFVSLKGPLDRKGLYLGLGGTIVLALTCLAVFFAVAHLLDSMAMVVFSVITAGTGFTILCLILVSRRLRTLGYPAVAGTALWAVAFFIGYNLMDMRSLLPKLVSLPFLVLAAAPFLLTARWPQKKSPDEPRE